MSMSRDGMDGISTESVQDIDLFALPALVVCREISGYFNSNNIDIEDKDADELELLGGYFSHIATTMDGLKKRESQICDSISKLLSELSSQNNTLSDTVDEVSPSFGYPLRYNMFILHWKRYHF